MFDASNAIPFPSEPDQTAIFNPYMFNGRRYDSNTNLYYYRTRYMDPEQGRFIARDTIGAWADPNNVGNPFTYMGNKPWSGLDPYGPMSGFQGFDAETGMAIAQYHANIPYGAMAEAAVSEMHTDLGKALKVYTWTGPRDFAGGAVEVVSTIKELSRCGLDPRGGRRSWGENPWAAWTWRTNPLLRVLRP